MLTAASAVIPQADKRPPPVRYASLLASLLLLLIVYPFVETMGRAPLIFGAFFTLIVVNVIYSLSNRRVFFWVLLGFAVPATMLQWLASLSGNDTLRAAGAIVSTLMLGYTAALILQDVLRAEKVNTQKVCGALSVYLMFGIIWATLFAWIAASNPGAFSGAIGKDVQFSDMLYYSFVTLTTLGYGDIVPALRLTRVLASLEALLGQLYLAVLVARMVGLHIVYSRKS